MKSEKIEKAQSHVPPSAKGNVPKNPRNFKSNQIYLFNNDIDPTLKLEHIKRQELEKLNKRHKRKLEEGTQPKAHYVPIF